MIGHREYWTAKRLAEGDNAARPFGRKRPKMPSAPWRAAAVICFTIGALVTWLVFRDGDAILLRVLAGGLVGFVVGMIAVETVWERRLHRDAEVPPSPIGPRR